MSRKTTSVSTETTEQIMARIRLRHGVTKSGIKTESKAPKQAPVAKKVEPAPVKAVKAASAPKAKKEEVIRKCECGCGGSPKTGRYLPGHDSKHRSALAEPKVHPLCGCGCGEKVKAFKSRFRPGHDAKFFAVLRKAEKLAAEAKTSNAKAA